MISDQGAFGCFLTKPSSLKKVAVGRMMGESSRWSVVGSRAAFVYFLVKPSSLKKVAVGRMMDKSSR